MQKQSKQEIIDSLKVKFDNEFSEEIFEQTYKFGNETIKDSIYRIAEYIASNETDKEYWTIEFLNILDEFKFVPGGRIISNAGIPVKGTTLLNCYVEGFSGENQDSLDGILEAIRKQSLILKSEGGYGFCCDTMRPRGGFISGIGSESPGAVTMLEMWDVHAKVITKGSGQKSGNKLSKNKIRKGAQMVTMSCYHPDIEEFITKKQTPDSLTNFNMSVLITDDFISAIKNNKPWDLIFPEFEQTEEWDVLELSAKETYNKFWDNGNLKKWIDTGYPVKIYKTYENANELFDKILTSTYNRNEPGILFIDTINRLNNLKSIEYINATNPCVIEGTLVNTPSGYIRIEDLKIGNEINTVIGKEQIKDIEVNKNLQTYKLTFSDGGEQIVTESHQYHCHTKPSNEAEKRIEVKCVKDLIIGNRVRVEPTKLASYDFNIDDYNYGLKKGILLGNGCYTEKNIEKGIINISSNIEDSEYNEYIKNLFGYDCLYADNVSNSSKSMNICLNLNKIDFEEFELEPNYSYDKNINIEQLNNYSIIIGILDGLLATDGTIGFKSNNPNIRFITSSKKLAQEIRSLLLYLGVHGIITVSHEKGGIIDGREILRKHSKYTVNITGNSVKNYFAHTKLNTIHKAKYNKLENVVINTRLTGNNWAAKIKSIEKGLVFLPKFGIITST